ncbi:unnamed protein product [marine sediment metagenome]|uniref:Uncharacterized protein n=1 Tax=marine sediment metagenome TaxID=412755 RepID=X1SCP3_9ZZZZ
MGKRNRERVARIRAGQEKSIATPTDPKEKAEHGLCPFPGCRERPLWAEGAHGFCFTHEKFVADLVFIFPQIQWQPVQPKSGLVLPGSPEFGMPQVVKKHSGGR